MEVQRGGVDGRCGDKPFRSSVRRSRARGGSSGYWITSCINPLSGASLGIHPLTIMLSTTPLAQSAATYGKLDVSKLPPGAPERRVHRPATRVVKSKRKNLYIPPWIIVHPNLSADASVGTSRFEHYLTSDR